MKKVLLTIMWIIIFIGVSSLAINLYICSSTKNQIISIDELNNDYDAILVLGCKVDGNRPSLMLSRRLEKAIDVYNSLNSKFLLSGDHGKKEYDELNVMNDYLKTYSISSDDIFLDHAGFSTYDSIYRAKNIFGVKKIVIITQNYHLYRSLYLANKLGIEAYGVSADDIPYKSIMIKNEIREYLARTKDFFKGIVQPQSKYLGELIDIHGSGTVTLD